MNIRAMRRRFIILCVGVLSGVSGFSGCGGGDDGSDLLAAGAACRRDDECSDGLCVLVPNSPRQNPGAECVPACTADTDCPSDLRCGIWLDNDEPHCVPVCKDSDRHDDGFACVAEKFVHCDDVAPGSHCQGCGCEADQYCPAALYFAHREGLADDGMCRPLAADGGECFENRQCQSGNCDAARFSLDTGALVTAGRCIEARDSACSSTSSCECLKSGVCAQACGFDPECKPGEVCLGSRSAHTAGCHAQCNGGAQLCPTTQTCETYGALEATGEESRACFDK